MDKTSTVHIIHDIDRDGWGSVALLAAELMPQECRLYPSVGKNGFRLIERVTAQPGDSIWLLDIPTPSSWALAPRPEGVEITWVDHHPVRAGDSPPDHIRLFLPVGDKPKTTMHLLVEHGLVPKVEKPMLFVRSMCVPGFETTWTRIIDGIEEAWLGEPVTLEELPAVLARAPANGPAPAALRRLEKYVHRLHRRVDTILNAAKVEVHAGVSVIHLKSADRIPLKYFGLRAQVRYRQPVSVLVHRNRMFYCGRPSNRQGMDFLKHFESRMLAHEGHPYVAFAKLKPKQVESELKALISAITGDDMVATRQREQLKETIEWARTISTDLGELQKSEGARVHFRPSSNGIAMVGLLPDRPQRGKTGITKSKQIAADFEKLFKKHCVDIGHGRKTPEKELQSFLISESYKNKRSIKPINAECDSPELIFVTDEIPVPSVPRKIVCDLLAARKVKGGYIPVLLELKSDRAKKRLIEQVESYSVIIDNHADLYAQLYSALLGRKVRFVGPCEKWIVWPLAGKDKDPQEESFAELGVRVVGYEKEKNGFSFRVGKAP